MNAQQQQIQDLDQQIQDRDQQLQDRDQQLQDREQKLQRDREEAILHIVDEILDEISND